MHKILNAISAAMLGLAMLLTSAVASQAAPVSPTTIQLSSNVEQVRDNRADWKRHHSRRNWDHNRRDMRRHHYNNRRDWRRSHWDNRRHHRNHRYYQNNRGRYGNGYVGKSWQ
jgi:hypothetical protein